MSINKHTKNTSFGTPIQKGDLTISPTLPNDTLKTERIGKIKAVVYVRSAKQTQSIKLERAYYEKLIKDFPEFEFAGIYEDYGVSATITPERKGLLQMIEDCKAGKIDVIVTKDVSRISRNVGDFLNIQNTLNNLNPPVEIIFGKEPNSSIVIDINKPS